MCPGAAIQIQRSIHVHKYRWILYWSNVVGGVTRTLLHHAPLRYGLDRQYELHRTHNQFDNFSSFASHAYGKFPFIST